MMSYLLGLDHQYITYNDVLLEVSIIVISCMMYQIGLDHKRNNCFWGARSIANFDLDQCLQKMLYHSGYRAL